MLTLADGLAAFLLFGVRSPHSSRVLALAQALASLAFASRSRALQFGNDATRPALFLFEAQKWVDPFLFNVSVCLCVQSKVHWPERKKKKVKKAVKGLIDKKEKKKSFV